MKTLLANAGAVSLLLLASCGSDSNRPHLFSTDWQDNRGQSIASVQARLRAVNPPARTDVVVAVAGASDSPKAAGAKILGLPLAGGSPWSFTHALDVRPIVAGPVVVGAGAGELFAIDAATGKRIWARPTAGLVLLGAGDDGEVTAVTLSRGAGSTLLVIGRDGSVRRTIETDKTLGAPAVVGGVVFVPWSNQYVSALDAKTGDELGRVVLQDKVSRALTIGGGLYFGEISFVRWDDKIAMASRGGASRIGLPARELPGTPRLLVPGTEKQPPFATALDRDRLFARPSSIDGPLAIDSGHFYASYYRLVLGFDATGGRLAWVHTHPTDIIGGGAVIGGIALCDEEGKVTVLDGRTGGMGSERSFGEPIRSCVTHTDTFRAPSAAGRATLAAQIAEAVVSREATLATAQRLLLRELATLDDEIGTKTLIDIASDPRAAPVLIADARASLASRRNGASYMLASLGKHYDFLRDVLATPPTGPIADALAAMKETRGASLLASHLMDPADTDDDVKRAAGALAVLATKEELPTLRQFFAIYRGTAETDEIALAVGSVGEALLRLDPKDGRATVEAAVKDPMTVPTTRGRLGTLLSASTTSGPAPK